MHVQENSVTDSEHCNQLFRPCYLYFCFFQLFAPLFSFCISPHYLREYTLHTYIHMYIYVHTYTCQYIHICIYIHTFIYNIFIFSFFFTVDAVILVLYQVVVDIFFLSSEKSLCAKSSSVAHVKNSSGNSLAVQWSGPCAFTVGGTGLISGWGTKLPQGVAKK